MLASRFHCNLVLIILCRSLPYSILCSGSLRDNLQSNHGVATIWILYTVFRRKQYTAKLRGPPGTVYFLALAGCFLNHLTRTSCPVGGMGYVRSRGVFNLGKRRLTAAETLLVQQCAMHIFVISTSPLKETHYIPTICIAFALHAPRCSRHSQCCGL